MSIQSELNEHDKQINECLRKTDILEIVVYGKDGSNGLRAKVKELDDYIDNFKPRLAELNRIYNTMEDIKKNIGRVFWVVLTSSILALGSRFVQIKIEDTKIEKAIEARAAERATDNTQRQNNFESLEETIKNK